MSSARMKLVAQTSSRPGCSRNAGMILSSSLVTPCSGDGGSPGPLGGDLLHLVDEHDGVLQFGDLQERLAQRAGQPLGIGGQPGGEHLHERPLQPGGDRLGEGGLAGAGGAEEHHGARRHHAEFVGEVGLGQRQDQAALQQLLLAAHAGHVLPQVPGQDAAAEQAQGLEFLALHGDGALEVAQVLLQHEAAAQERLHPGFGLRHQGGELVQPVRRHPVFDGGQQRGADARGRGIRAAWPGRRSSPGRGRRGRRRHPPPGRPGPPRRRGPFRRTPAPRRARRPARRWWP